MPDSQQSGEDVREASVIRFLDAIMARSPNGEPVLVQYHPDGDWTVFDDAARHSALSTVNVDEASERKAFEAWAAVYWPNSHPPQSAWDGWNGRAALSTKAPLSMEGLEG